MPIALRLGDAHAIDLAQRLVISPVPRRLSAGSESIAKIQHSEVGGFDDVPGMGGEPCEPEACVAARKTVTPSKPPKVSAAASPQMAVAIPSPFGSDLERCDITARERGMNRRIAARQHARRRSSSSAPESNSRANAARPAWRGVATRRNPTDYCQCWPRARRAGWRRRVAMIAQAVGKRGTWTGHRPAILTVRRNTFASFTSRPTPQIGSRRRFRFNC